MPEKLPVLYKYHRYNPHLYELLATNSFYCATHSELNDPFDLKFKLSDEFILTINEQELLELFEFEIGLDTAVDYSNPSEFLRFVRKHENWFVDKYIDKMNYRVVSFNRDDSDTNIRMWSHYAGNFNGVRMKFDFNGDNNFENGLIKKVNYNGLMEADNKDELHKALWNKKQNWTDEDEYRYIQDRLWKKDFNKLSLKAITFGMNVHRDSIFSIMCFTEKMGYECDYFVLREKLDELVPMKIKINLDKYICYTEAEEDNPYFFGCF